MLSYICKQQNHNCEIIEFVCINNYLIFET